MGNANKGHSLGPNYRKLQNVKSRFIRIHRSSQREGEVVKMYDREYVVRGGSFRRI